jgi:hypothetical protein
MQKAIPTPNPGPVSAQNNNQRIHQTNSSMQHHPENGIRPRIQQEDADEHVPNESIQQD